MDYGALINGLIGFLCFIPILTFHEWAHAWTAHKCGDDTARLLGRVSLNPLAHIDPLGTLLMPAVGIMFASSGTSLGTAAAGLVIGWGKPVPVNIARLRHRVRDDILVSMAGPAMNVVLAVVVLAAAKFFQIPGWTPLVNGCVLMAWISLFLCFFNLLPVPPLDGSHVMRHAIGMSEEAYLNLCRYSFLFVFIVIQIPGVRDLLRYLTRTAFDWMARALGVA